MPINPTDTVIIKIANHVLRAVHLDATSSKLNPTTGQYAADGKVVDLWDCGTKGLHYNNIV